jgi:serine protease Do
MHNISLYTSLKQTSLIRGQGYLLGLATCFLIFQLTADLVKAAPESFAPLVEIVSPAVVNITTSTTVAAPVGPQGIVPEGSPFEDLFRDFQDRNGGNGAPRNSSALGSGFVISSDGYVITNNHVIEDADEIRIEFRDGMELEAKVIGVDKNVDIALLKVEHDKSLPFVQFGDSDISKVGDWVMAVGNPLGQGFSVSVGIISARNRELSGAYDDYIQTDAAINRGNSGGPLFNMGGEVIGVNTAILSPNGGSIGIGFSMSSNVVAPVVEQLREFGEVRRGWLGVNIGNVTDDMAEALGLSDTLGAIVLDVFDGPALDAGLKSMDIIISFDGQDVKSSGELVRLVGKTAVGKLVNAIIIREGAEKTLSITLGQRPDPDALAQRQENVPKQDEKPETILGMLLLEITDAQRQEMELPSNSAGLIVMEIDEESVAFEKGIRPGDIISDVGQKAVTTLQDFLTRVGEAKKAGRESVLLLVRRDGQPRFVVLPIEG